MFLAAVVRVRIVLQDVVFKGAVIGEPVYGIGENHIASPGTDACTINLVELESGVTYYVRAYATNAKGTAYGNQITFTTK